MVFTGHWKHILSMAGKAPDGQLKYDLVVGPNTQPPRFRPLLAETSRVVASMLCYSHSPRGEPSFIKLHVLL